MAGVTLQTTRIRLEGNLTVPFAPAIQARLLTALDKAAPFVIDVSAATAIDVSFLQILVATQKSALSRQMVLSIDGGGSPMLKEELRRCGFLPAAAARDANVIPLILEGAAA